MNKKSLFGTLQRARIFCVAATVAALVTRPATTVARDGTNEKATVPRYTVTRIGPHPDNRMGAHPDDRSLFPVALNDRGQVLVHNVRAERGFVWDKGTFRELRPLLDYPVVHPRAINNRGQVAGTVLGKNLVSGGGPMSSSEQRRAVLWENGEPHDLGTPPDEVSEADAINDQGEIVGRCYLLAERDKKTGVRVVLRAYPFLWSRSKGFRKLDPQMTSFGDRASAINRAGQVVGRSKTLAVPLIGVQERHPDDFRDTPSRAFIWQNGATQSINVPGAWYSNGDDINDRGDIVGQVIYQKGFGIGVTHAFVWRNGKTLDLGELAQEPVTGPLSINNAGHIVGCVLVPETVGQWPFLYRNGKLYRLEQTLPEGSGWTLGYACDINNKGQIIGSGRYKGAGSAFLLTPR